MIDWNDRFRRFAAFKEARAREARISPLRTDVDCAGPGLARIGSGWSLRVFDGPFYASPVPSTGLVFVQSRDGNTGAADPSTLGGGDTDAHLIYEGLSRVTADAVLAGAETVRGGDVAFSIWRREMLELREAFGKPRHPVQIVATLRGLPLAEMMIFNVPGLRAVLLTTGGCADLMRKDIEARPWITPVIMEHARDLARGFGELRRLGIERISAIGGRTFAAALIDAGLVQDLYVTTSTKPGGEPKTPMYPKPLDTTLVARKLGTGDDSGLVFEHRVMTRG